jgi:tripartite ATP-independent transporter DctM subunit
MDWPILLIIFFGSLVILMATGLPVAVCFILINAIGVILLWGSQTGLNQFIFSVFGSITSFTLLPIPMFILMGDIMFQSGIASEMISALDKWLGKLPGRLALLAVAAGTLLSTLTGVSMASVAMLGSALIPEMEKQGYKKAMTLGPILGSGGLAVLIPPSMLAVFIGAIGEISIGKILIATIFPGIMVALIMAVYIIVRCRLQPHLAPSYAVNLPPLRDRLFSSAKYVLPTGFIFFLVIGLMLMGIATPTEAAATGAVGCIILTGFYKKLNWNNLKQSFLATTRTTGMMFMIMVGSTSFAQILSFSGASAGISTYLAGLSLDPLVIIIMMQVLMVILGMFMSIIAILMVALPIFVPVVLALGFDPVWFAILTLINAEISGTSPPYGLNLFVMKGVVSKNTTMGDIYRAAIPFCCLHLFAMALIITFPQIAMWLPNRG